MNWVIYWQATMKLCIKNDMFFTSVANQRANSTGSGPRLSHPTESGGVCHP